METDFINTTIGMLYGMGLMLITVNLGLFPIGGPSLLTGILGFLIAAILFHCRKTVYERLGVTT
jgi:hypothetical protein